MALPAVRSQEQHAALSLVRQGAVMTTPEPGPVPQQAPGGGCPWCHNTGEMELLGGELARCPHCPDMTPSPCRYCAGTTKQEVTTVRDAHGKDHRIPEGWVLEVDCNLCGEP